MKSDVCGYYTPTDTLSASGFMIGDGDSTVRNLIVLSIADSLRFNTLQPHSALGYLPPAPETIEAVQTTGADHICA